MQLDGLLLNAVLIERYHFDSSGKGKFNWQFLPCRVHRVSGFAFHQGRLVFAVSLGIQHELSLDKIDRHILALQHVQSNDAVSLWRRRRYLCHVHDKGVEILQ